MIKTAIAFNSFLSDLTGSETDRIRVKKEVSFPIESLFDEQKTCDRAKKRLKSDFDSLLYIYFSQFKTGSGVDADALGECLALHEKNIVRHIGKASFRYLSLIAEMGKELTPKRKGLLAI